MQNLASICWVSRNRAQTLLQSIKSLEQCSKAANLSLNFSVAHSGNESVSSQLDAIESPVSLLDDSKKRVWSTRLRELAKAQSIDPMLVNFALQIDTEESERLTTTGANRNALLLSHVGERILSCDDDVRFETYQYSNVRTSEGECLVPSSGGNPYAMQFFDSEWELKNFQTLHKIKFTDFLEAHDSFLGAKDLLPSTVVGLTVSGTIGDSGFTSPRIIFSLSDNSLEKLCEYKGSLDAAISSRLLFRQALTTTLTQISPLMAPCVGFDNRLCLPPFFPIGRNQDGAYSFALQACLPEVRIAHLNYSVLHQPEEVRSYVNSMEMPSLRINDLLILIWVDFLKSIAASPALVAEVRYKAASEYLHSIAGLKSDSFLRNIYDLVKPMFIARALRIREQAARFKNRSGGAFNKWQVLAEKEARMAEDASSVPEFALPKEALLLNKHSEVAAEIARRWVVDFADLLAAWPTLRDLAKKCRPFD